MKMNYDKDENIMLFEVSSEPIDLLKERDCFFETRCSIF